MIEVGSWYNDKDVSNTKIIDSIVRDHFSLDYSSYNYFHNQISNPEVCEQIYSLFAKYNSTRISFDLPASVLEKIDNSWSMFKSYFEDFYGESNIQYSDYSQNVIEINKNKVKIKKAVLSFYLNKFDSITENMIKNDEFVNFFKNKELYQKICDRYYYEVFQGFFTIFFSHYKVLRFASYVENEMTLQEEPTEELREHNKQEREAFRDYIKNEVESKWADVTRTKISNKKMKIVLSINYADWFLCSTKENWGSCLNLESDSINYWYGLPGLIGDKNRIMIYITPEGETKNYKGIETDRFLYRTWAVLDEQEDFNVIKWYPNEKIGRKNVINEFLSEKTGFGFNQASTNRFRSLLPIRNLFTNNGFSLFPYCDDSKIDDDGYISDGSGGMFYFMKNSSLGVYDGEVFSSEDFTSLSEVINANSSIEGLSDAFICSISGTRIARGYEYYSPDGEVVCEECYHENYFTCSECGEVCNIEDRFFGENGEELCSTCFHDTHFVSDISGEVFRYDKAVEFCDEKNELNTLIAAYTEMNDYILNEENNIYYKPEFMILTKEGNYMHIDDFEKQLELGLGEAV